PEVGAYERGTGTLVNGEALIEFSEHYKIVANASTMTVQITPLEWDTYGIAVVEKTSNGFRVKELKGGEGNFSFDWVVTCVRNGKEDFQVLQTTGPLEATEKVDAETSSPGQGIKSTNRQPHHHLPVHSENCLINHEKQ
ncbi:MAG: hypothetical protein HKN76_08010, partial [Saprospiraceae bacterium]|nr:hypothetical protein [Saprospiraceae bacterium]